MREEGKENSFSLGQSLWIGGDEFEDLDEIIARYVSPMASHARDLLSFKYYRETMGGKKDKAEEILKDEKRRNPSKIHYVISASQVISSSTVRLLPQHSDVLKITHVASRFAVIARKVHAFIYAKSMQA